MKDRYISPLRYPGGKAKLLGYITQIISENGLVNGLYVEPFAGGASVALGLLCNGVMQQVFINDKDRSIYAFWYSVLYQSEDLCALIQDTPITIESWQEQKLVQKNKSDADLLHLGFSTFFLNRTNRSGILNAGVIGGQDQNGQYKIDARFNKTELIGRIKRIALYRDKITLSNLDAVDLLKTHDWKIHDNKVFLYLDPPYYVKGKNLYLNYYRDNDHKEIADALSAASDFQWVISYDDEGFISSLYKGFRCTRFQLNYSANNSGKGNEVMFYSNDLIIPDSIHL